MRLVLMLALFPIGCGSRMPAANLEGTTTSRLSAGASHTCLLKEDGSVSCWGSNVDGQLGSGDTVDRNAPVSVTGIEHAVAVSAGSYHACVVLADGSASCWGWDSYGQVGKQPVTASPLASTIPELSHVSAVATGGYHSCALDDEAGGHCWGQNDVGQLGNGANTSTIVPSSVFSLPKSKQIAAGGRHSCSVVQDGFHDGTVQCWGNNDSGELGDGSTTERVFPTLVSNLETAVAVAAGFNHTCALLSDGRIECWGANEHGQLGDGGESGTHSAEPVEVPGLRATAVAAGYNHTCAVLTNGEAMCWGANSAAQLGDGTTIDRAEPVRVLELSDVTSIAGGAFHSCAQTAAGAVFCWGLNESGQLGDGTLNPHTVPAPILEQQ